MIKINKNDKYPGKKILVFAAHPDDEVLGMGGTISFFNAKGYSTTLCIATDGSSTQYKGNDAIQKKKIAECYRAAQVLKLKNIIFLGFKDMQLDQVPHFKLNENLQKVIADVNPEMIFSPSSHELNKDHHLLAESLKVATRPVNLPTRKIYFYEILSSGEWNLSSPFAPNTFVDISKYISSKLKAFSCYKTEIRKYPHPRSVEGVKALSRYRGLQAGVRFAEAFFLYRDLM